MSKEINVTIDGKKVLAKPGENLIDLAKRHGIHIPHLCYFPGMGECLGTCRVCMVNINDRPRAACTFEAEEGMAIEVDNDDLNDMRKAIIELLFVEGNHFCPSCEKSGDCHLQALAYAMAMTAPRFHYRFNNRDIDFSADNILFEHNRCILCKRCTHKFENEQGEKVFAFKGKGHHLEVEMNIPRANALNNSQVEELVELCPVGAILKKGQGFDTPYGERTFDKAPISIVELDEGHKGK